MNKSGRTNCDDHECELCVHSDVICDELPCDVCSVIGSGLVCQYEDVASQSEGK